MTRRRALTLLAACGLVLCAVAPAAEAAQPRTTPKLRVVVEPAAGYGFLDHAVTAAHHQVLVELYELADATMEADLAAAVQRHVTVQVLLDKDYNAGYVNQPAFAFLTAHHVAVHWTEATHIFHEKAFVVDATAYVGTGNLEAKYYATTRDFWVVDTQQPDVAAVTATFRHDWPGAAPAPGAKGTDLVWSPGAEPMVLALIARAHHTISLESEELSAKGVISALVAAVHRHVVVHVTMTYSSEWRSAFDTLVAAGVQVHVDHGETPIYVHAKALCVDCTTGTHPTGQVLVGSQNLAPYSLTRNRELSIETAAPSVISPVAMTLAKDFAAAPPYVP